MTIEEAAMQASVSYRTIERAVRSGELQAVRGHVVRTEINPDELANWIERRQEQRSLRLPTRQTVGAK